MPLEVVEQSSASESVSADTFATAFHVSVEGKEDREHQTTFETWGTPDLRDKPGMALISILPLTIFANRLVSSSCSRQTCSHQGLALCLEDSCKGPILDPRRYY